MIRVGLIIESFFQGHEEVGYAFVAQYLRGLFPNLLDLDRFNARRRDLIAVIEAIRRDLRDQKLDQTDPIRLVDSAPIALMTYTRGARCASVVGVGALHSLLRVPPTISYSDESSPYIAVDALDAGAHPLHLVSHLIE